MHSQSYTSIFLKAMLWKATARVHMQIQCCYKLQCKSKVSIIVGSTALVCAKSIAVDSSVKGHARSMSVDSTGQY